MTRNFTHKLDRSENKTRDEERNYDNMSNVSNPSDSVIKNLLNYSKALSVVADKLTGNIHLILLN